MRFIYTYRSAVARSLLLIQLFMLTNAVVFRHAHRLPDGTIVVHAHPFLPKALGSASSDPVQPNDHTRQELIWLDAIADAAYLLTEPTFFVFQAPAPFQLPAPVAPLVSSVRWGTFTCFSHRGPPMV